MPPPSVPSVPAGPVSRRVASKLLAALQPTHLQLEDHSALHGGAPGAETHLGVLVVSGRFEGLSAVQRHRLVHAALQAELRGPLHALSITARTPRQWESDPRPPQPPPPCMGGSKAEREGRRAEEQ